jgi:hypothetical protein
LLLVFFPRGLICDSLCPRLPSTRGPPSKPPGKDRIARIERGEDVAGGFGKPMTFEDLLNAGMTRADIARCIQVAGVKAFGFHTLKALREARDRAELRELRALHRRCQRDPCA